jgi:TonB family protein
MKTSLTRLFLVSALAFCPLVVLAQKVDPKPVSMPSPGYPEALTDSGLSGIAEVDVVVKADGTVGSPELAMATHRAFGRAAMAAVVAWKFEPGSMDGTPIDRKVSIPFRFQAPLEQVINYGAKRKVFTALPEPALAQKDFGGKLKVKKDARPAYPRALMGSNLEEKVTVKFVIAPDGSTLNPAVVGLKHKEFEGPALQTIAQTTYEPPITKDGKAVYVETTKVLEFAMERGGGGDFGGGGGGPRRGGGNRGGGGGGEEPDEE